MTCNKSGKVFSSIFFLPSDEKRMDFWVKVFDQRFQCCTLRAWGMLLVKKNKTDFFCIVSFSDFERKFSRILSRESVSMVFENAFEVCERKLCREMCSLKNIKWGIFSEFDWKFSVSLSSLHSAIWGEVIFLLRK